jgi:hypothetical protein
MLLTDTVPTEVTTAKLAGRRRRLLAVLIDGVIGLIGKGMSALLFAAGLRTLAYWTPLLWVLPTSAAQI